jgi:hypothetical protein
MAERIVVGFLTQVRSVTPATGAAYLKRVIDLRKKAEALGGRLCAFGSQSIAFDFGVDDVEEAISLATGEKEEQTKDPSGRDGLSPWSIAIAQGDMLPFMEGGSLASASWGAPLVVAIALARIARPGEVLIDHDVSAVVSGEILTWGSRVGKDGAHRVRGLVIDARLVFRRDAAEKNIAQLSRPLLVARHAELSALLASHAPLGLIRADSGFGGTRLLDEIEAALSPGRSLRLCTAGAEPLGALRCAFARSLALHGKPAESALSEDARRGLERLLAGDGLDVGSAAELVAKWVTLLNAANDEGQKPNGAVLVDDANDIDDPSLEAVARAAELGRGAFRVIARLGGSPVPFPLASLDAGPDVELGALARASAEELATSIASGQLSAEAAKRWARRGRYLPLGIVEALAEGVTTGELTWVDGVAIPRSRGAGRGLKLDPKDWIQRRLQFVSPAGREVLTGVAILGMDVGAALVDEMMKAVSTVDTSKQVEELSRTGWLLAQPEGFYGLPSRTHREVILGEIPDDQKGRWHGAASIVIEKSGTRLASAEAARHAALAGDPARARRLALVAAKASRESRLEGAKEALLAFAEASPDEIAPRPTPPPVFNLDSWIAALRASGDRGETASRLEAIAALAKGETTEALAALREGVVLARHASPASRSRASLAYGIALAVAGRRSEALFAALEALARAREGGEKQGERACARFLARLTSAAGHREAALKWQALAGAEASS